MGGLGALPSRRLAPYFLVGHDRKTRSERSAVKRYTSFDDRFNTGHSITLFLQSMGLFSHRFAVNLCLLSDSILIGLLCS